MYSMTDGNLIALDRYEERLARAEEHAPKCTWCGEAIYEYGYRIDDLFLCESCMENSREYVEEEEW